MTKQNDELDEILDKYDGWEYSTEPLKKEILDWHKREMDRVIGKDEQVGLPVTQKQEQQNYDKKIRNKFRAEQRERMEEL